MLTAIPSNLVAGDTWKWSSLLTCYPASAGWNLETAFRGPSQLDVIGVPDGDGWTNTAAADDTDALVAGTYSWQARVSRADEVHTVEAGTVVVAAALSAVTTPLDGRTKAEKLLEAADTAYLSIIAGKSQVQFGDQSFTAHNLSTLSTIREKLRAEVAAEKSRNSRNGGRRQIHVRFTKP